MSAGPALILIRHAHRELSDPTADNGLSGKGRKQSLLLLGYFKGYFKRRFGKSGRGGRRRIALLSSPSRRCVETLDPIARSLKQKVVVSELLSERQSHESVAQFGERVGRGLRELCGAAGPRTEALVLCSHGDWLPIALKRLCGARAELKKGGLAEIEDGTLVKLLEPSDL